MSSVGYTQHQLVNVYTHIVTDFSFNTVKSVALRIGPRYKHVCAPLVLAGAELAYVQQTKYLGVVLMSAREFRCSFDQAKIKFYRCFNACIIELRMLALNLFVCTC